MKLITVATELSAAIAKIGKASASLDNAVQIALASATFFAIKDGNIEPLTSVFTTVSKGLRRAAMQAWIIDHAPVVGNTGKDVKEKPFVFVRAKVATLTDSEEKQTEESAAAYATTTLGVAWTDYKPETLVPETFDVQAMLTKLVKSLRALQTKGSKPVHGELIAKLEAMTTEPAEEVAPL